MSHSLGILAIPVASRRGAKTVFATTILCIGLAACGGGGDGNSSGGAGSAAGGNNGAAKIGLSLVAGHIGGTGAVDAMGIAARFANPAGIATDPTGNMFVADTVNHYSQG